MKIYSKILGNLSSAEWREKAAAAEIEYIDLDPWTAQKSRFVARGSRGREYAVALRRHTSLRDGDIICYQDGVLVALRVRMNDIMVIDMGALVRLSPQTILQIGVEVGHALGNQHWPAVVQATKVYVPLTTDRRVMESVMRTHHIEHIAYSFRPADQILPYLSPSEVRRLLGGEPHAEQSYAH